MNESRSGLSHGNFQDYPAPSSASPWWIYSIAFLLVPPCTPSMKVKLMQSPPDCRGTSAAAYCRAPGDRLVFSKTSFTSLACLTGLKIPGWLFGFPTHLLVDL